MDISERKKKILAIVVEKYIESAEPVGSKAIAENGTLKVSSATIRNELAELTSLGYLEQPHTSSGRVPTPKGYRVYVNELMQNRTLSKEEQDIIASKITSGSSNAVNLTEDVGKLAADLTNYPAVCITSRVPPKIKRYDLIYIDTNTFIIVVMLDNMTVKNRLIHLPFSVEESMITKLSTVFNASFTNIYLEEITPILINSTEIAVNDGMGLVSTIAGFSIETLAEANSSKAAVSGQAKLLQLPEFKDPEKAHQLISYISDKSHLSDLTGGSASSDIRMLIGPENIAEELKDSSVILASYDAGDGTRGVIGVIGPTRMDYSLVAAKLKQITDSISRAIGSAGDAPLPGFGKLMIKDVNSPPPGKDVK